MISVRARGREETLDLEEFETRVRAGRILPSTMVRFPVVTGAAWVKARELEVYRRLYAPARAEFTRSFSLGRFPVFTLLLCALQVVIFVVVGGPDQLAVALRFPWSEGAIPIDPLIEAGAKVQPNILELGQSWRLLTANLLHRDVGHLVFNLFFLFNIGGAVENAFRLRDYVFVLLASGVATTGLSTLMSPVPSVGISGVVLGLFGCLAVFGFRYGSVLPLRYRRYFGWAALPYALFILYVGLLTPRTTDNWGHLGGLLGGMAATTFLQPRLWVEAHSPPSFGIRWGGPIGSVLVVAFVWALGPILVALGPRMEVLRDGRSGLVVSYPATWFAGRNHLDYIAKGNALGTSIGLTAETRTSEPYTIREVRSWFVDQELGARELAGDVTRVQVLQERPLLIEGGRALEVRVELESRAGRQFTRNVLISRGYYRYAISLSAPQRWADDYATILDRMVAAIRLEEPDSLIRARRGIEVFPGMTSAHVRLGTELARVGRAEEAASAFRRALGSDPEDRDALYGLAKLSADYGGDLSSAETVTSELWTREPEEPALAGLLADLRQRLGDRQGACDALMTTFDLLDRPPDELRSKVVELRCLLSY